MFLGGTCNGSTWRDKLTKDLKCDFFNQVVADWTERTQLEELKQREECDYVLYVITPKMTGVYSIAEVIDDSNKRPNKTLFCFLTIDDDKNFNLHQIKSLNQVSKMIKENGAKVFNSIKDVCLFLNS